MDDTRIEEAKFDVGGRGPSIDAGELPWAYVEDRITAMVRDPDSAYLYWEITDEGIAGARSRLGPAGEHGWYNLRVYDTTGRDFDGTNANDYFDIGVDRADREHYLMIRRPTSAIHAEIGIKTDEGFFQPIARSGRAEFPRNAPSPDARLEWMTVTDEGPRHPCAAPARSRYGGPEPALPGREGAGYLDVWRAGFAPSKVETIAQPEHRSWSTFRALDHRAVAHVERWWRLDEWRSEWRAGLRFASWEHFDPQRVAIELLGTEPHRIVFDGGEMIVYGPWQITIGATESGPERRVLSTWQVRWVRATTPAIERWERVVERRVVGGWERRHEVVGASEAHVLLERGASELLRIGGSDRIWLGASEWAAGGASETLWLGASRLTLLGASERLGGSEWLGGSERMGGSERLGGGERVGASERWTGRPGGA